MVAGAQRAVMEGLSPVQRAKVDAFQVRALPTRPPLLEVLVCVA
jgi:hypothetical protein